MQLLAIAWFDFVRRLRMYDVDIVVRARKLRADGAGNESEAPLDAKIDIGVLDAAGNVLAIEKRAMRSGENRYSMQVSGEPARAGIDPLNKLIDRDDNDNTVAVSIR